MIRQPRNWNEVQEFTEQAKLPLDAYVCKVIRAEVQGEQLCVAFDITEGAQTGFYKRAFATDNRDNKKWKGVLRLWLPKDDGSEKDEWTKSIFKGMVTSFEKSNPGYKWNWDETSLSGRMIGIMFRNEEWEYEGKTGWAVRPFRAMSVDTVRSGDYTLPKDKPLKNKATSGYGESYDSFAAPSNSYSSDFAMLDDDDAQLLF